MTALNRSAMPVDFPLYLITDRRQVPSGRSLLAAVHAALDGGVRAVQLREKDLPPRDLYPLALELRTLTKRYGARLLINDRLDVALAVGADGVHLAGTSLPLNVARRLLGAERLIGVSTHSLDELRAAQDAGADFATFGPVYPTPSKARYGPPVGPELLKGACAQAAIPVFALGGVKACHIPEIVATGARGIAVISAVLADDAPATAAASLVRMLNR